MKNGLIAANPNTQNFQQFNLSASKQQQQQFYHGQQRLMGEHIGQPGGSQH